VWNKNRCQDVNLNHLPQHWRVVFVCRGGVVLLFGQAVINFRSETWLCLSTWWWYFFTKTKVSGPIRLGQGICKLQHLN
jgi:hypothetical protein